MCRPEKEINWKRVDDLLAAGCLGTEIATEFDMHPRTFYDRVEKKFGITFTAYSTEKHAKGEQILREIQYLKAIGAIDHGDNTLLIWLGKTRLKQRENDVTQEPPTASKIDAENKFMEKSALLDKYINKYGLLEEDVIRNESETEQELLGSDPQV